jgi:hypothetical protein
VAAVVVFVGGDLRAGADHEVAEEEVRADDPPVLAERGRERALRGGVLESGEEGAGGNAAALERRGGPQKVVVLNADPFRAGAVAQDGVDGQPCRRAEVREPQVAGVAQPRDEAQAEQVEQRKHELGRAVGVGGVFGDRQLGVEDCLRACGSLRARRRRRLSCRIGCTGR